MTLTSPHFRRIFALSLLLGILPLTSQGQSLSEFEQWKKQQLGEFKQYKDEIDKEFASFLKQRWKAFPTEEGFIRDKKPKPVSIPVAKPVKPAPVKTPEPVAKLDIPVVQPAIRQPPVKLPPPPVSGPRVTLTFLGHDLAIVDGLSSSLSASGKVSQQTIQQHFSELAQSDYPVTLDYLLSVRKRLDLNDWAYVQLIEQFSQRLRGSSNHQTIVSWFLLLKSGLDTRVAFSAKQVYLLVATRQNLYDIAYFKYGTQRYYAVSQQKTLPGKLFSYDGKYPKKLTVSDVAPSHKINSKDDQQLRQLRFRYAGKAYTLAIPYNRHTVKFLASYPQMDINQYFRSPLNDVTANALIAQLRPIIAGLSETEAVNLLLSFVQNAFDYKTDGDQFGAENYMFIEETLFYPSSDCEDRSIIFAWLVQNLLGLNVVGLDFPGHIATAVELKQPVGVAIRHDRKTYTVADPTYINARAGMKMPQYKHTQPKVISII
jgi:hypothetical protein